MSETSTLICYSGWAIGREELTLLPTPPATETHRPIPETLGFRHIEVVHDEYAISPDGMKVFVSSISSPKWKDVAFPSGCAARMTRACAWR
jgi:hypothetical protein